MIIQYCTYRRLGGQRWCVKPPANEASGFSVFLWLISRWQRVFSWRCCHKHVHSNIYKGYVKVWKKQGCKWLEQAFPSSPSLFHLSPLLEKWCSNRGVTNGQHWTNSAVITSTIQWESRNETEGRIWSFVLLEMIEELLYSYGELIFQFLRSVFCLV